MQGSDFAFATDCFVRSLPPLDTLGRSYSPTAVRDPSPSRPRASPPAPRPSPPSPQTLSTFAGDFRAWKAQIAAQYNGVTLGVKVLELGKDDKSADFRKKSVVGKLPLLETPDGVIFESNAIARFVAKIRRDTELSGRTFFEAAQVDAWLVRSAQPPFLVARARRVRGARAALSR